MNPIYVQLQLFDEPPPPPPPDLFNKRGIYSIGDLIEIRESGLLYGKRARIIDFDGNTAIVKAENWAINRRYSLSEIALVRRKTK